MRCTEIESVSLGGERAVVETLSDVRLSVRTSSTDLLRTQEHELVWAPSRRDLDVDLERDRPARVHDVIVSQRRQRGAEMSGTLKSDIAWLKSVHVTQKNLVA